MDTPDLINMLRTLLRDFSEKNAIPFSEEGIEYTDEDLEWALMSALAQYNVIPPLTMYQKINTGNRTELVLIMNLAMAKALEIASIRHARDAMPYGSEVTINDTEQRPGLYMSLANDWENKMVGYIKQYKRARDSRICAVISSTGGWGGPGIDIRMADDRGIITSQQ